MNDIPKTILLIEDNPGDARLVQAILTEAGIGSLVLETADRLATGLERLEREDIDLILADLSLPDSQGLDTCDRLRAAAPDLPIVVLTGTDDEDLAMQAVQMGAQDYLVKGQIDGVMLARTLRYAIERQKQQRQLRANERRLHTIITHHADGILIVDKRGSIRYANPAATTLFGKEAADLVGIPFGYPLSTDVAVEIDLIRADEEVLVVEMRVVEFDWEEEPAYLVALRDITERKQALQEIARLKEYNEGIIQNMSEGIIIDDVEGNITFANQAAASILGYDLEDLIGMHWNNYLPTGQHDLVRAAIQRRQRGGSDQYELLTRHQDGVQRTILVSGSPRFEDGQYAGTLAVFSDITERKLAEEKLRLQALALDSAANAIMITNRKGIIEWVNPAFTVLTGYSAEETIGQSPRLLKSGVHDSAFHSHLWETILGGKVWQGEMVNRHKDGNLYTAEETITPLLDDNGQITHFIGIMQDITARKQAVEALRENQKRLETTLLSIGDAVIATDTQGKIEVMNPIAEALTGWSSQDAVGRQLHEVFCIVNEDTREVIESPVERVLREGAIVGLANHTILIGKDGTERPIADSGAPIVDETGHITGVVLVFRDQSQERLTWRLIQARLSLIEYASNHTLEQLITKALDEVGAFVDSPIGFFHFLDADQKTISLQQWSTPTLDEFCQAKGKGLHYDLDQAGVWVDCVAEKKPVVHNDYASLPHKKGLPEGHAEVIRELVTPVMRDDKVVAIVGVGNKPSEYTAEDVEIVSYFADIAWEIVRQKRAEEALRRQNEYLAALHEITLGLINKLDLHSLLDVIMTRAAELANTPHGFVDILDEEQGCMKMVMAIGNFGPHLGMLTPPNKGAAGQAWRTGQTVAIQNYDTYANKSIEFDWLRAITCVPLRLDDEVIGVIGLGHDEVINYDPDQQASLEQFANLASLALHNARLYEMAQQEIAERKKAQELVNRLLDQQLTVNALTLALGESSDLSTTYHTIYKRISTLMDTDFFAVAFYDSEQQLIRAGYAVIEGRELDAGTLPTIPLEEKQGTQSRVIRTGQPVYIPDLRAAMEDVKSECCVDGKGWIGEGPLPDGEGQVACSGLYVPMKVAGETIGVMQVQSCQQDAYTPEDMDMLVGLANVAAVAIQNAQLVKKLEAYGETLEQAVEERTAQLREANERLKDLDRMKDEFISTAAHELRTPLTSVMGFSELLLTRLFDEERQRRYLELINMQTQQVTSIIDDMLDVARLESGRGVELQSGPVDVGALAAEVIDNFADISPTHTFVNNLPADLPLVAGDAIRLLQVLRNLVSNAVKYSPEGGSIIINGHVEGASLVISVRDQGIGLTPEQKAHLFEKFWRADNSTTSGTGLGLAISKLIIEDHGGRIWAESEAGVGSTFIFTIPVGDEADPAIN